MKNYSRFELGKIMKRILLWDDMNAKDILAHQVPGERKEYQVVFKIEPGLVSDSDIILFII